MNLPRQIDFEAMIEDLGHERGATEESLKAIGERNAIASGEMDEDRRGSAIENSLLREIGDDHSLTGLLLREERESAETINIIVAYLRTQGFKGVVDLDELIDKLRGFEQQHEGQAVVDALCAISRSASKALLGTRDKTLARILEDRLFPDNPID